MKNLQPLYSSILKKYWGYDDFRGIQREIIESISTGHDTLGLMPTGGGKSITFQVPALIMEGTCVVITPLIALMKDQVQNLRRRGIRAAAIYSGMNHDEMLSILENAVFGAVKLLYVSPERLSTELFRTKLRHMKVSFICVDEAHCISQWGYDFRPSYLQIADIRSDLPDIPILALTATATPQVVDDIQDRLQFRQRCVFRMSFERKNLAYVVRYANDRIAQLIHILNNVPGSAIVYARSRQRTKEYAKLLNAAGLNATFFHAGLDNAEKDRRQSAWQRDEVRIMVATNAFGMGIDKPDVRLVAHIDCPNSIEAYFQEAGRAGRDGKKAYAVLICNKSDMAKLQKRIDDTFPDKDYIRDVYDHLAYFFEVGVGSGYNATFEFPLDKFCYTYEYFPIKTNSALKVLDRAGYIEYTEEQDCQAQVMFTLERDNLYLLKNVTPNEDRIIVALLRCYSGLFIDFQYIDEALLSKVTELPLHEVYQTLKGLAMRNIIRFIPQKRTPIIRYLQRREESRHLQFPPAAYEELKERFQERIKAMQDYIDNDHVCRSRQLLRYFGEYNSHECGQCDVCLAHKNERVADARQQLLALLSDKKPHSLSELYTLHLPVTAVDRVLQELINEETIVNDDGLISLS
ncbi:MAG: RecQ family ATP-dependent DNA helicase [Prevotella sp.]|jgi:ATP-dependent DNA helicase RecQ